jgi:hypothetical protein
MHRPLLAAVPTAALLVSGCASQHQCLLPPGEDPDRLAEAIARRGRGDGPVEAEPPGSFLVSDCVKTSAKVAESPGLDGLALACCFARGGHPNQLSFGEAMDRIWSGD